LTTLRSLVQKPSVDAIVPCYLPNEKDIIEETLSHILQNVESPGKLKLWLVYNSPHDMPDIEARLHAMSLRVDLPQGRELTVFRADDSRSKAENINTVLPKLTAEYTVVYDADHHPDPESLMLLIEKLQRKKLACVQGSTYIRDLRSGILARIIDAEFFVTHFVYFPVMRFVTRNAVFCGSNGLWRTDVLQHTTFNPRIQTEDIDVSVRMLLEKHQIDFCPESRSGELAPISFRALFKQRVRWAIGWDQVSFQLWQHLFAADAKRTRKVAVAYVCWSRWCMQVVGIIAGIVTPLLSFLQRFNPDFCHCGMGTQLVQTSLFYFYLILFLSSTVEAMLQTHHRGYQSWIQVTFVALFMGFGWLYIVFQASLIMVSFVRIGTGTVGGWIVTARKVQKSKADLQNVFLHDEESQNEPSSKEPALQEPPTVMFNDLVDPIAHKPTSFEHPRGNDKACDDSVSKFNGVSTVSL
jgi:cellulose synthase/poly-beta-1,6-N-acetylglucosamine synthase-like glycosyltransferase